MNELYRREKRRGDQLVASTGISFYFLRIFWQDHYFSIRFLTCTLSRHGRMATQLKVDKAAFTGCHRFKRGAASSLCDLISHSARQLSQLFFASTAITFHVYH